MDLNALIRAIPDFPQPGILFRDITPLLGNPEALRYVLSLLEADARERGAEAIAGIESRGFIFGTPVAAALKLPFVPIRKPGKLPAEHLSVEYSLEYGTNQLDIHSDALAKGQRTYIVDDLLATGGTARAGAKLVELIGGVVAGFGFAIELEALAGRAQIAEYPAYAVVRYK